ncbi:MAG TPA: HdeD family acid-resistance protein [Gammaproteobacteria bacterium]
MSTTMSVRALRADPEERSGWGWWVALGVLLLIAGLLALGNLLIATAASVFFVGAMMIVGGIAEIAFAFSYRGRWGRFVLWLLLGLLYVAAGFVTFRNPALATAVLTLVLAASLVAVGILKIAAGLGSRHVKGRGWLIVSGVLTLILGGIIAAGWPVNSLWVLGLFLAIDLLFAGIAYVGLGAAIRSAPARAV